MVLVGMLTLHLNSANAATGPSVTTDGLTAIGTGGFVSGASGGTSDSLHDVQAPNQEGNEHTGTQQSHTFPTVIPNPTGNTVIPTNGGSGFQGLDHFDTRFGSSDGNNAFSLEPPDQGLCVGHGDIVEPVNDVMTVYNTSGIRIAPKTSMNGFFGLPVAID